ncbi:hypothetical protein D3C78_1736520 [compost metagenome]
MGLIRISLMHAPAGISATKRTAAATCSGCNMRACSSAVGRTARVCSMGVATSPGKMAQARMPLTHSSVLSDCVSAPTACLAAV